MIRRGDNGDHVLELQRALIRCGHEMPRFGPDGWAGAETFETVEEFAHCSGVEFDDTGDEIGDEIIAAILTAAAHTRSGIEGWPGPWLHDHRNDNRDKQRGKRAWDSITGITLHQTATCFLKSWTPDERAIRRAIARVQKIKAHFVILRCGHASYNAPLDRIMAHGHAFNRHDVGIEVDGYFAGVHGDLATFWRPKSRPERQPMMSSPAQVESTRQVVRHIVEIVKKNGGEIKYIHAHRQTHRGKPSDPGQLIWQDVALWAQAEFGLTDGGADYYVPHHRDKQPGGLSSKAGPGRPIPREWNSLNTWNYRKKP